MRKSINVETVTSAIINKERARMWGTKVTELVQNYVASTTFKADWCKKLKEELEFANANLELLSENDYNWLLEQQKSPTGIIELPPKTHGVRETYNKADTEIMDKFKSVLDKRATKKSMDIDSPEFKKALAEAPFVCKTHCDSDVNFTVVSKTTDSTVKKVRKPKKVYLIQDKKTKQYVTYVDHHNLELTKYISETRLYTSMGNADSDCKYLSRYKDTNCKVQLEVVEMPDDEKFVLLDQARNNKEYFVRIGSTGVEITKNIDEAARYVSYKSASTAVKKTDKELPYRFSIAPVKNVKPLVLPVEKPVKKVKEPKVKEEWVLYINGARGVPWYYNGEISIPTYQSSMMLEMAKKFSSYGAATKAKCKLIKAGFITLDVANVEDCK
jgi:hypothetical protein